MDRSRLIAWFDGEADASESAAVQTHVDGCEECGRRVREIRELTGDIARYARILAAPKRPGRRWAPAAAAAAVLLAAALRLIDAPGPVLVDAPAFTDPRIVRVAVPLQDLLPIGAVPPGAVIVGEMVLDVGGTPRSFRLQGTEPSGD